MESNDFWAVASTTVSNNISPPFKNNYPVEEKFRNGSSILTNTQTDGSFMAQQQQIQPGLENPEARVQQAMSYSNSSVHFPMPGSIRKNNGNLPNGPVQQQQQPGLANHAQQATVLNNPMMVNNHFLMPGNYPNNPTRMGYPQPLPQQNIYPNNFIPNYGINNYGNNLQQDFYRNWPHQIPNQAPIHFNYIVNSNVVHNHNQNPHHQYYSSYPTMPPPGLGNAGPGNLGQPLPLPLGMQPPPGAASIQPLTPPASPAINSTIFKTEVKSEINTEDSNIPKIKLPLFTSKR